MDTKKGILFIYSIVKGKLGISNCGHKKR